MTTFDIHELDAAVERFLHNHADRQLLALDYRDDGVYFGKNRENQLIFHDGRSSNWTATSMLRIFDANNELYALKAAPDTFIIRIIEDEDESTLFRLNDKDAHSLHSLQDGVVVFDERHELWGTAIESETADREWLRYTEARGNAIMLPVKLDRNNIPVYSKVRNYIEARKGSITVVDSRLCGLYYLENGEEKAVW